jgi:hypothetical protein
MATVTATGAHGAIAWQPAGEGSWHGPSPLSAGEWACSPPVLLGMLIPAIDTATAGTPLVAAHP